MSAVGHALSGRRSSLTLPVSSRCTRYSSRQNSGPQKTRRSDISSGVAATVRFSAVLSALRVVSEGRNCVILWLPRHAGYATSSDRSNPRRFPEARPVKSMVVTFCVHAGDENAGSHPGFSLCRGRRANRTRRRRSAVRHMHASFASARAARFPHLFGWSRDGRHHPLGLHDSLVLSTSLSRSLSTVTVTPQGDGGTTWSRARGANSEV